MSRVSSRSAWLRAAGNALFRILALCQVTKSCFSRRLQIDWNYTILSHHVLTCIWMNCYCMWSQAEIKIGICWWWEILDFLLNSENFFINKLIFCHLIEKKRWGKCYKVSVYPFIQSLISTTHTHIHTHTHLPSWHTFSLRVWLINWHHEHQVCEQRRKYWQ